MTPQLSVVVLSWNKVELTRSCIRSIRTHTDVPYELIVVDNGSDDRSAEVASSLADTAVLNDTNLGFAAGMNLGLAAASGEFVVFVNNDTEFPESWASRLVKTASSASVGIVMPAVTSAGMAYAVRSQPGTSITRIPPFSELPSGVVFLMRRDTALDLGGWNEMYYLAAAEDFDLLFTVWSNGLDVMLDERVLVEHLGSASARTLPDKDAIWRENREQFLMKWSDPHSADIPRLAQCTAEKLASNLDDARLATGWIRRYFAAHDSLAVERQRVRNMKRELAARPESLISKIRRRVGSQG